jgi:RNA polymerase sigma factor (sigma-70 family)
MTHALLNDTLDFDNAPNEDNLATSNFQNKATHSPSNSIEGQKEGFKKYLSFVSRHAQVLKAEEEKHLAELSKKGDLSAKQRLTQGNLRLVLKLARYHASKHPAYIQNQITLMEIVQEGNLGLLIAVDKFKPQLGYRFSTYATWWIQQSILKALNSSSHGFRLPDHVFDALNKINRTQKNILASTGEAATEEQLASVLKCSVKKVRHLEQVKRRMISLDSPKNFLDGGHETLLDSLVDENSSRAIDQLKKQEMLEELCKALQQELNEKERDIIIKRFGLLADSEKMTLEAIGQSYGITRESIRQIEAKAIKKLRQSQLLHPFKD